MIWDFGPHILRGKSSKISHFIIILKMFENFIELVDLLKFGSAPLPTINVPICSPAFPTHTKPKLSYIIAADDLSFIQLIRFGVDIDLNPCRLQI